MRTIEEFLVYFRRQRSWTRSLVAAAPEACFDWRPAPDAFSCGELVRHLIQSEAFWRRLLLAAAAGQRYDPFGLTGTVLVVTDKLDDNVFLSSRNLTDVLVLETREVDPVSLVRFHNVVLTKAAVAQFEEMLG